jgi:hypothetical protein
MLPIAYYLLKVIICSSILYGYYWLLLCNKIFHKYNRFYLMASVVLSLLLPLIKINFWQQNETTSTGVIQVLQAVSSSDEYMDTIIVAAKSNRFNTAQLYPFAYLLVSIVFIFIFLHGLYIIFRLLKKYPQQIINSISFVNTDDKRTPFSFLKYIFWNNSIDIETTTGQQIFKHELAHVQEKHSHDKLFINIILIFFWCNPFYWLIRKELNMIHEFIADKKAVEDSDTAAFAAMILQATYPQHRFQLTNNFFYSPIKRRLLMLTKNKNPKVNYFGRIMVLPLAVLIFTAFTFKINKGHKNDTVPVAKNYYANKKQSFNDTVPFSIFINAKHSDTNYFKTDDFKSKALIIVDGKEIGNFGMNYIDKSNAQYNSLITYNPKEAKKLYGEKGKYGVIKLTIKDVVSITADSLFVDAKNNSIKVSGHKTVIKGDLSNTLIYIDGKISTPAELEAIPASKISSVDILKGDKLDDIIDAKGKTAMINVQLKPVDLPEIIIHSKKTNPLYIIDGKESTKENLDKVNPERIEDVRVIKESTSLQVYGEKGRNGVVIVNLKPEKLPPFIKKMTSCGDLTNLGKNPYFEVDGKEYKDYSLKKYMQETGIKYFDDVKMYDKTEAIKKYGEKAQGGAIIVTIKNKISEFKDPIFSVGKLTAGCKVDIDAFKKQTEIHITDDYSFVGASVYFSGKGFPKVLVANLSGSSLQPLKEFIDKCEPESVVTFDNIMVKKDGVGIMTINGKSYSLYRNSGL